MKNAAAVALALTLLAGCSAGSRASSSSSPAAPTPVAAMCAKVTDDEVAKAFGVSGWHGKDVKPSDHDPSDVACQFTGDGYSFQVRTTVGPGTVASADDALRVLLGIVPGQPVDDGRERIPGLGDAAVYSRDATAPQPVSLDAVKRVGTGWRSLEMLVLLAQVGSSRPLTLPKDVFVAFAQKVMAKL